MTTTKTATFVATAINIANDDSHGYSQVNRWSPDFDCSSLMYFCAEKAGYPINRDDPRYTGSMIRDFTAIGFRCDAFDGNLSDLEIGDILLNTAYHTAVYIGSGKIVEASIDENGGVTGARTGDQTGHEIHIRTVYDYPWTHVLTPPKDEQKPAPTPATPTAKPSQTLDDAITTIAIAVLDGRYGNGDARKQALYDAIQSRVNELL